MNCSIHRFSRILTPFTLVLPCLMSIAGPEGSDAKEPFIGTLIYEAAWGNSVTRLSYTSDGKRMRIELGEKESPSRIWLRGLEEESGVVTINPFKQSYSSVQQMPVSKSNIREWERGRRVNTIEDVEIPAPESTELLNVSCLYYNLKTEGPDTEVWILPNVLPFPDQFFTIWNSTDEIRSILDWICRENQGIPIQIFRSNWRGKKVFSLTLTGVENTPPNPALFHIPEGYSKSGSNTRAGPIREQRGQANPRNDRKGRNKKMR